MARVAEVRGAGSAAGEGACACAGVGTAWPAGPGAGMLPGALYPFGGGSPAGERILCA